MAKPKTRFVVIANGQLSELLSVRELKSGDLMVAPKRNGYAITDTLLFPAILEERMSVHTSPNSSGHTLTFTVTAAGGKVLRSRGVVDCTIEPLRWPLFLIRPANLSAPVFRVKPHPRDKLVKLGDFNPLDNSIIIIVLVGAHNALNALPVPEGWNAAMQRFTFFDVAVIWSFIPLTSLDQGDTAHVLDGSSDRVNSLTVDQLVRVVAMLETGITDSMLTHAHRELKGKLTPQLDELLRTRISMRSATPYQNTNQSVD